MQYKLGVLRIVLAFSIATTAALAAQWTPLSCGKTIGYRTSAKVVFQNGVKNLQLTYYGKKPADEQVAQALLGCVKLEEKHDASTDIVATTWLHASGTSENDDEQIDPFPPGRFFEGMHGCIFRVRNRL